MPSNIDKKILEQELAKMHGRKHCIFVGRATAAIYLALKTLGHKDGKVVMPATLCLSVPNAVIYSGLTPLYCDVSLKDFNIDIDSLEKLLKEKKDIRAVIAPHMYGHPTDMSRLLSITEKYKIPVIEDVAQAMGGSFNGRILGSFGDFSILSFGHTKIIDVDGGGALLFDKDEYEYKIAESERELSIKSEDRKLGSIYREAYYTLMSLARKDKKLGTIFSSFPWIFKDIYLFGRFDEELTRKVHEKLPRLKEMVSRRNENAEYYKKHLIHPAITHPKYNNGGVSWRYSFLIKSDNQLEIAEAVRREGIDISNWYYPLHSMYEFDPPKLKNAEYIGSHIFNLWVEPTLTRKELKKNVDTILQVLKGKRSNLKSSK